MEDQIHSYTNQVKKAYRQSLDAILPFAVHETVVHGSDDEFENFLKDYNCSMKDLQACIYLLERDIDLQREIIHGLTHLLEIHKYEKASQEYDGVLGKLVDAQSRLALSRSRTVRCLTRQIQRRCADPKLQQESLLPSWPGKIARKICEVSSTNKPDIQLSSEPTTNKVYVATGNVNHKKMSATAEEQESLSVPQGTEDTALANEQQMSLEAQELFHKHNEGPGSESLASVESNEQADTQKTNNEKQSSHEIVEPVTESVTVKPSQSSPKSEMLYVGHLEKGIEESCVVGDDLGSKPGSGKEGRTSIKNPVAAGVFHHLKDETEVADQQLVADTRMETMRWDPVMLLKEMLGKVKDITPRQLTEDHGSNEETQMAGYMEKLPMNKRKATLVKTWRKRYFKIMNGKLFYFEDHRATAPISFVKLANCQVKDFGNKCLEVVENVTYGGKFVILKCNTYSEMQDWKKAIEYQAKQNANRSNFELEPEEHPVIIVDFGSSSIKAGFLEDEAWPQVVIPSVYAVNKDNNRNITYGFDALTPSVRYSSKLVYPLRSAVTVGKSVLEPNQLIGFLELIFRELQVDPTLHKMIMTLPVNLTEQDKDRMVEIMLDCFQVAGVYMSSQAMLSMYSYSATSGIVVNIGENIEIVPVEDGYVVGAGVCVMPFGGRQVTDHFVRMLASSGHRYFSEIENYIGEYLKIKTCYVSQDYEQEKKEETKNVSEVVDMTRFNLPNGDKLVMVGKERFTAFEGFFKPELWGKDSPSLQDLVYNALMTCSIDSRKGLCRNIYLSGATTKVQGFAERLQKELNRKVPSSVSVQVHASEDRQFSAFIGAAVLASLHTFESMCITRDEWEEFGPEVLRKWDNDV